MKKSRHRRQPAAKVSEQQRKKALAAHEKILDDPKAPAYAKVRSASAILNEGARQDSDDPEVDPTAPVVYEVIPCNRRDPGIRYGLHSPETQRAVIVPTWAGFPLELQPESHYAAVVKPTGVVAERGSAGRSNLLLADLGLLAPEAGEEAA